MVKVHYQMTVRVLDAEMANEIGVIECAKMSELASLPREGEMVQFNCVDWGCAEVDRITHCDGADWTTVWLFIDIFASGIDAAMQQLKSCGFEEEQH